MIEAWVSQKSFRPKDGSDDLPADAGGNAERDFPWPEAHDTHASGYNLVRMSPSFT